MLGFKLCKLLFQIWEIMVGNYTGSGFGLVWCILATVFFKILHECTTVFVPVAVRSQGPYQIWRWKNIATSWVHAIVAGTWAVLCFCFDPQMAEDLINKHTLFSYLLVCFAVGYFIHDSFDMMLNRRKRETFELLGHHFVIVICFGIAIVTRRYCAYAVVSLLAEVNSIFLHLRQLLQIAHVDHHGALYRCNALMNTGTFVIFRIVLLSWMTRWLVINRARVPLLFYSAGSIGLAIMVVMNAILFYRILQRDFNSDRTKVKS